ncbi:hypothetical protein F2Q68_00010153 [Brassica cretica]|uniref:Uncharacterized protein n=1 Tax=Brassica cretica TaxID=69181 RepID=A0A8S9L1R8_BRACR|nr:hypothetical protein F2Q68_00010153 [Brassica cretica]
MELSSHSLRWLCIVCQNPKLESLSPPLSRTHRLRLYYVVFAGQFLHGFHRTNLQYWVTILLTIVAASNISSAPAGVSDSIPVSANDEVLSSAYIKEKTLKKLSKQQLMGPYAMKKVQIQNKEQLELVRVEIRVSSLFNQPSCSLLEGMSKLEGIGSTERERLWPELVQSFKDIFQRLKRKLEEMMVAGRGEENEDGEADEYKTYVNNEIQTSSSSPPQFVVTTTVPNLTDLVSVISIFITTKPCHHQTSSSSPPRFIVVATTALRLNKVEEAEEAWWWWSRHRLHIRRSMARDEKTKGWRKADALEARGWRLEARGGGIRVVGRDLDFFFVDRERSKSGYHELETEEDLGGAPLPVQEVDDMG